MNHVSNHVNPCIISPINTTTLHPLLLLFSQKKLHTKLFQNEDANKCFKKGVKFLHTTSLYSFEKTGPVSEPARLLVHGSTGLTGRTTGWTGIL